MQHADFLAIVKRKRVLLNLLKHFILCFSWKCYIPKKIEDLRKICQNRF